MKLSEVIINNKEIKYIDNAPVGMRYAIVDESMNRVISKHPTKESANKTINQVTRSVLKEVAGTPPAPGVFPAGTVFPLGNNTWGIGIGNAEAVIRFTGTDSNDALKKANKFLENIPEAERDNTNRLRRAARSAGTDVEVKNISGITQTLNRRVAQASATGMDALEKLPRIGPTLRNVLASPFWRGFGKFAGGLGLGVNLIFNMMEVINDLELEAESNSNEANELIELRNILVGQVSVQLLIILRIIFGNARLFNRALSGIKWTVRAVQGGAVASVGGAIPGAISFLVTEAGWLIAGWVVTSPTVQRAMAEWFHGNLMGVLLGGVGAGVVFAADILDNMLDGQYGTAALRNGLGFKSRQPTAGEDEEFASSSEWAKLVFHGLLFPPGRENLLVPYIGPEQRATMLRQVMGIEETASTPAGDSAADVAQDDAADVAQDDAAGSTPRAETPAERSARTREQSLRTDYSNPNYTRAQPFTGPR